MKRIIALFLLLAVLLFLWGCVQEKAVPAPKSPLTYYYRAAEIGYESDNGVVRGETRDIAGHEGDLCWILRDYFKGPQAEGLVTPFPKDMDLISCELDGETAVLQVNKEFANLAGIDLSVAASCIAATCFGVEGVEVVSISVPSGLLDGKQSITLRRDGLLLRDNGADMMRTEMTLYFADQSSRYLIGEEIPVSLTDMDNPQEFLMRKLAQGPKNGEVLPVLPKGTEVLNVEVSDGVCNVNLSRAFTENASEDPISQYLALMAVANTMTQTENVSSVELYEEGSLITSYGIWQLNASLTMDANAVGPVRTGLNEFDVDLYLPLAGQERLGRIPARIRQTASETAEELVAEALLDHPSVNCVENPFPAGTELLSIREAGGLRVVDLSQELLNAGNLQTCVRSLVSTLCALDGVNAVRITVEGKTPEGGYGDLFSAHSHQADWVLF